VVDYVVTLQGKGDMGGLNTDTFRQDSKPKADILLVIDDSCSMGDKQQALADNMAAFLQYATSNQVDFQLGVVTTNTDLPVGTLGALRQVSGRKVLRDDTPNLASEFANLVKVGISGSGTESCMEPATAALTAPLISDPSRNAGFLRPDAVLAVVCISDAGDQATNGPAFYLNQLLNIKGAQRSSLFTYNVVGPTLPSAPVGCEYDMTAGNGRHEFMVAQTNGVLEEICTPNWAAALERVGKSAFGYRSNFYLTARPDLSAMTPISVSIDGTSLPEIDPNRGARIWQYDSAANSINFDPFYLPEPGKTLTVTYVAVCIL